MTNRFKLFASASVVAVSAFGASQAQAAAAFTFGTLNGAAGNYNIVAQSATAASGNITTSTAGTVTLTTANADNLASSSQIKLTLPSGYTWTSAPGITIASNVAANCNGVAIGSGTISGATVTYTVTTGAVTGANGCSIGFGSSGLVFNAGTDLNSAASATPRVITVELVAGANAAASFASAALANGIIPVNAWTAAAVDQAVDVTAQKIAVTSATPANQFVATANTSTRVARIGSLTVTGTPANSNTASGAAYTLPDGNVISAVVTGDFSQASRVYLSNAVNTCQTTAGGTIASGSLTGTVSGGTATFTGLTAPAGTARAYALCYENNGSTTVIPAGVYAATISSSLVARTVTPTSTGLTLGAGIGSLEYDGKSTTLAYVTGGSAYQYFARVTNPGNTAATVLAVVTNDTTGLSKAGVITTSLSLNANALYDITAINTATGANLTANDRARVQVISSNSTASVSGILFNTATGVITPAN